MTRDANRARAKAYSLAKCAHGCRTAAVVRL